MGWQPGYHLTGKARKQFEEECRRVEENFNKNPPHFQSHVIKPSNKIIIVQNKNKQEE